MRTRMIAGVTPELTILGRMLQNFTPHEPWIRNTGEIEETASRLFEYFESAGPNFWSSGAIPFIARHLDQSGMKTRHLDTSGANT